MKYEDYILAFNVLRNDGSILRQESHLVKAMTNAEAIAKYFDGCPWMAHMDIIMCKKLSDIINNK